MPKQINQAGIDLIKRYEGCQLESYPDPHSDLYKECTKNRINPYNGNYKKLQNWEKLSGNPWTIGYGHTGNIKPGQKISQEEAYSLFLRDLSTFGNEVSNLVKFDVSINQFSALVSFAYNCGIGALKTSTLLKKLNGGDILGAADQFLRWDKDGNGVQDIGLAKRRATERQLFNTKEVIA